VSKEGKILFIVILTFMVSALTFASDKGIVKLQGIVMAVEVKKNTVTVNERAFAFDQQTSFFTEKGLPTTPDKMKVGGWVYIEAVPDKANRRNIAKKVYLIPGLVPDKEKHRYSFFE